MPQRSFGPARGRAARALAARTRRARAPLEAGRSPPARSFPPRVRTRGRAKSSPRAPHRHADRADPRARPTAGVPAARSRPSSRRGAARRKARWSSLRGLLARDPLPQRGDLRCARRGRYWRAWAAQTRAHEPKTGRDDRNGHEPHQTAPRRERRREEDPVAVRRAELGLDLGVRLSLAHALGHEVAHLSSRLRRRVLHGQALAHRAAKLRCDLVDAFVRGRLVRARREDERARAHEERAADENAAVHRAARVRSVSIPVTSVASSIGPMCLPAITPSGPMKNVSGGPKTPYERATRPSVSATVVHPMPMRRT